MRKDAGARFLQSKGDFPVMVNLGRKKPSWELRRWGLDARGFAPLDGGGYALRGDRWNLLYSGERQSHRFTILDGEHFEYDIILNREPESNRIFLGIEGGEGFDFFRQPDNLGPEMLRGSYAVYKKETVINSPARHVGTGKLCHIHRPKIIDARGRQAWGDVSIDRGVMALTVPEGWLGEAKYPVVVDPVVGSSTVGAYETYDYINAKDYAKYLADKAANPSTLLERYKSSYPVDFDSRLVCNKLKTPLQMQGAYNAYAYISSIVPPNQYYKPMLYPLLYTDFNNEPKYLLVHDNTMGDPLAGLANPASFAPRWTQSTLTINGSIAANTDVWFGFWGDRAGTRFDYGAPLFQADLGSNPFEDRGSYNSVFEMSQDYDFYDIGVYTDDFEGDPNRVNVYPGARYDLKASMYLAIPGAYTRTVTQWAMPTDTRKLARAYKRTAAELLKAAMGIGNARAANRAVTNQAAAQSGMSRKGDSKRSVDNAAAPETALQRYAGVNKTLFATGNAQGGLFRLAAFPRFIAETVRGSDGLRAIRELLRRITAQTGNSGAANPEIGFRRDIASSAHTATDTIRLPVFLRTMLNALAAGEYSGYSVVWLRRLPEQGAAFDRNRHIGGYLRGLYAAAGSAAETGHAGAYSRKQSDTAHSHAASLRHLFIFLRLATLSLVRDFIIGRFLRSKEELVIKSPVCRELALDSRMSQ
jgi:hypothetical protein